MPLAEDHTLLDIFPFNYLTVQQFITLTDQPTVIPSRILQDRALMVINMNMIRPGSEDFFFTVLTTEDGKTYQTVTIWIVTIWKHFIRWLISGMKIFQNLFGMKYIQMVTGKWYENYSDRTQIDLVWTSFIWWLVIGMKISYCHQMNCHHLKYPLNLTL